MAVQQEREFSNRIISFIVFILFSAGIALVVAAFATQHWYGATAVRDASFGDRSVGETDGEASRVAGGIFYGYRQLNYGLGVRREAFSVYDEMSAGVSFMSLGVWLGVVLAALLAVIVAVAGLICALVNTVVKPVDTLTGPVGLFIWSATAFTFSCISLLFFVINFFASMTQTVLLMEQERQGFSTEGRLKLGFSFWLFVAGTSSFVCIFLLLCLSAMRQRLRIQHNTKAIPLDGAVLMY